MKSLNQWQKEMAGAANAKYPNNSTWSEEDRLLSIGRQMADLYTARMVEKGVLPPDPKIKTVEHRAAALIADILIYCEMRNRNNIEEEMKAVLAFFNDGKAVRSNE